MITLIALHANFVKNPKKSVPSISAISELSIVGAEYMAIALNDSDSGVEIFKCMLCNKVRHGLTDDAVRHLISLEHRMNYLVNEIFEEIFIVLPVCENNTKM